jgi:hypothetical protein
VHVRIGERGEKAGYAAVVASEGAQADGPSVAGVVGGVEGFLGGHGEHRVRADLQE